MTPLEYMKKMLLKQKLNLAKETEREYGKWVYNAHTSNYSCPKCRKIVGVVRTNFCPKCGADMRGDANG